MDQPNGAALDSFHNILVCDSRNHRIQLLNDQGKVDKSLLTKTDGLKLPMAIKTDPAGFLLIAEYQGNVKTFRYMEAAVDLLPAGKFISTAAKDAAPELVTISCTDTQVTNSLLNPSEQNTAATEEEHNADVSKEKISKDDVQQQNCSWVQNATRSASNVPIVTELSSSEPENSDMNAIDCTTMSESVL